LEGFGAGLPLHLAAEVKRKQAEQAAEKSRQI
jgi:hypothetical protein